MLIRIRKYGIDDKILAFKVTGVNLEKIGIWHNFSVNDERLIYSIAHILQYKKTQ